MKINTKIRYGLRTLINLALSDKPLLLKDIAENNNISVKFLEHIIHDLKVKKLIINYKGKKSGYVLAKPANKITIYEVFNAFDDNVFLDCLTNKNVCDRYNSCIARIFWKDFQNHINEFLKNKTLHDILNNTNKNKLKKNKK
ncbi:MAG: Rrf2 family transcriptional regulator [Bacteroidales bacterium]|nr:Rrf2 family transcriptional regulator [Bacteroidales bacterium]